MNASHHIIQNMITFNLTVTVSDYLSGPEPTNKSLGTNNIYILIKSVSDVLQATVYLRTSDSLMVLPDSGVSLFNYTFDRGV